MIVQAPESAFNLKTITPEMSSVGRYIEADPEPIRWTFKESLPLGSLGFLVSPGGVGKSYFLLQAACAVATDFPSIAGIFEPEERGKVVCIFGEDADAVIHHRFRAVLDSFSNTMTRDSREVALRENLHIICGAGHDMRLMRDHQRNLAPSVVYKELGEYLAKIGNVKLVILDPVSRFYAADENDNSASTYFCSLLEGLAKQTGATILASHHTSKAASDQQKGYKARLDPSYIRGASALPFGGRWACMLTTLRDGEVKKLGGEPEPGRYIAGHVAKKNVGRPEPVFYMERGYGGVLKSWQPDLPHEDSEEAAMEAMLEHLDQATGAGVKLTQTQFAQEFKGIIPGYGRDKLHSLVTKAILNGEVQKLKGKDSRGRNCEFIQRAIPGDGLESCPF